ncbi:MAG: hypothetical protein A3C90_04860 [Candidatus Magasanikbacteria bacterium RIFCSPHIGHO2_02_FULL_51_14]|uniref:Uncharacterized protein n=1 Tax=Candidatus Magasanikbacteria bacterium RIFCSPHIGHO2_02_FULL_51_14 TaxID=1798683 RepID=A0A1F6MDM4_9BACT|nr:MAG: hypothetical protein A3C90_04860 [Candidatus Magasanikbacteria bacterium RIFCSPHIGHO2_02_FULL_51_14]
MENWEVMEQLQPVLDSVTQRGEVYRNAPGLHFSILSTRLDYDWLTIVSTTNRGRTGGILCVIDPSQRVLDHRLVGMRTFDPKDKSPCTARAVNLFHKNRPSGKPMKRTGRQRTLDDVKTFLYNYLLHAHEVYTTLASEEELRAEIAWMQYTCSTDPSVPTVSGGLPGLGKMR